jgi:hypothetical protein
MSSQQQMREGNEDHGFCKDGSHKAFLSMACCRVAQYQTEAKPTIFADR